MFFLDEEISEEDQDLDSCREENDAMDQNGNTSFCKNPLSASFKQSVFEMDKKYPWVKKKRETNKYLAQDLETKKGPKDLDSNAEEDKIISKFATSVPITINYPFIEEGEEKENKKDDAEGSPKKKDILAKSFANYDFSYSDRLLSEQFPAPNRRRSNIPGSASLVNPQLHSLVGKSLDTRGNTKKAISQLRPKDEDEDFDSSVPPHVWAAKEADEDSFEDHSYKSKG
ncbi:hypothetical protein BY458DRAFT_536258 [Sporodiniella umbellata]|nr:hypothetical protein BY458DRAFT_536258 [Sporodiniella umbellata]